jgi:GNAT superfamily N-acetyltransferase
MKSKELIDLSRMYRYVRARQLEGTYSDDPSTGVWIVSDMRIAHGWGCPTELEWPYETANWPPKEPPQIDQAAKTNRIHGYQRVRTADECKKVLAHGQPVTAALEIVSREWKSAPRGHIPMPSPNPQFTGSHSVCLIGYDDSKSLFQFANSWGENWGDRGYGFLPYSYFERYQLEAWIIAAVHRPETTGSGIVQLTWGVPDYLAPTPLHGFEFFDAGRDECVGWAFIVERQGFADVEELFVRPAYRGKGYGHRLAELVMTSPHVSSRSLRLWVPHADRNCLNTPAFTKVLRKLGLRANRASRRWAAYVAM